MSSNKRNADKSNCAYLVFVNPQSQKEETVEINGRDQPEFVIGRKNSCNLKVGNPVISREHCLIKYDENGEWFLYDKSSSGTFLNKERIDSKKPSKLNDEDTITISGPFNYPFYFYIGDEFLYKNKKKNLKLTDGGVIVESGESVEIKTDDEDNSGSILEELRNLGCNTNDRNDTIKKLLSTVRSLSNENSRITKQATERIVTINNYQLEIEALKLDLQVNQCRNNLNNETIDHLKTELNNAKSTLDAKNLEIASAEDKICDLESNQNKKGNIEREVMLKVKCDIMDLIETELQCSICSEIVVESAVLSCTHLFCYYCINTWLKKKKECAVCRSQVKEVFKARAVDSFIDKILEKYEMLDILEHRKRILNERQKEKTPNRPSRTARGGQGRRMQGARRQGGAGVGVFEMPATVWVDNDQFVNNMFNEIGELIPAVQRLPNDMVDNLQLDLFPIVNLANDAIDLRVNQRRLRRRQRFGNGAVFQPPMPIPYPGSANDEVVIDLRESPERA